MFWWRHAAAALMMVVAMFLLMMFNERTAGPSRQTEADLSIIQNADMQVKLYLSGGHWKRMGMPNFAQSDKKNQLLDQALVLYEKAAERPSPSAIRRYGVLTQKIKGSGALQILNRLDSEKVLADLPKSVKLDLKKEADMWRNIYSGKVDPHKAGDYASEIRKMNMGPVKVYALQELYKRAGQEKMTRLAGSEAEGKAANSLVSLIIIGGVLVVAGIAGVVFIIIFIDNRRRPAALPISVEAQPTEETSLTPSEASKNEPLILFRGFIMYLILTGVVGVIVSLILGPELDRLPREKIMLYSIFWVFVLSIVMSVATLIYIGRMLHRDGSSLSEIGFNSRNLGKNVLWGIAGYCASVPLLWIAGVLWSLTLRALFPNVETPVNTVVPYTLSGNSTVLLIVFMMGVVLAPIFEETFFRGMLYRAIRIRLGITASVLLTSAAFAFIHPFPGSFLPIFALGSVFALLVETRRSIVPAMVAHALNNIVMFLMLYFTSIA